jgi:hypothetical protein
VRCDLLLRGSLCVIPDGPPLWQIYSLRWPKLALAEGAYAITLWCLICILGLENGAAASRHQTRPPKGVPDEPRASGGGLAQWEWGLATTGVSGGGRAPP